MEVLMSLSHDGKLSDYLYRAYAAKLFCDIEIVTSDDSSFYTHRMVLSAFSEYFQRKIRGKKESYNMKVQIDVDSAVFKVLIDFMYTGQLSVPMKDRISLYHASVVLEMESAQELLQQAYMANDWPGNMNLKQSSDIHGNEQDKQTTEHQDKEVTPTTEEDEVDKVNIKDNVEVKDEAVEEKKSPRKSKKKGKRSSDIPQSTNDVPKRTMVTRNKGKRVSVVSTKRKKKGGGSKSERQEVNTTATSSENNSSKTESPEKKTKKDKHKKKKGRKPKEKHADEKQKSDHKSKENNGQVLMPVTFKEVVLGPVEKIYIPKPRHKIVCPLCLMCIDSHIALKKHYLLTHKTFSLDYIYSKVLVNKTIRKSGAMRCCSLVEKVKKYMCTVCSKSFQFYSLFQRHVHDSHMMLSQSDKSGTLSKFQKIIQIHKVILSSKNFARLKRVVKCQICNVIVRTGRNYSNHLLKIHSIPAEQAKKMSGYPKYRIPQLWDCPVCDLKFKGNKALRKHFDKVHNLDDSSSFPCTECKSVYTSLATIKMHLRVVHKKTEEETQEMLKDALKCEVEGCLFSAGNMLTMRDHVMKEHPTVEYKCEECHYPFYVKKMLNKHMITKHLRRNRYMRLTCEICNKRYNKKTPLYVHQYIKHGIRHEGVKLYQCDFKGCNKICVSSSSLKSHRVRHSTEKNYKCQYCHQRLKTEVTLKKHVNKMHLGIRPHLCQVCGQRFGEDSELQSHIRNRHSTEKDFQCEQCPYATANKATFYTHLFMVHKIKAEEDNRKEYHCPYCPFMTVLGHRYKTHLNGHKNIREYTCDVCNKQFISSSTLRAHKQWAHSEKKYSCNQCGYQTKTIQKLNEHIRIQHQLKGFKPYRCPYCPFTCATGGNTRKHIKQKHKGQEIHYIRDDSLLEAARLARKSGNTLSLNYIAVQEDILQDTQPGFELQEFQLPQHPPSQDNQIHFNANQSHSLTNHVQSSAIETSNLHTLTNVAVHSNPIIDHTPQIHATLVPHETIVNHDGMVTHPHSQIVTLANVQSLNDDSMAYSAAIVNAINNSMQHL